MHVCRKASQRGNVSGGMTSLVSPVCVCVCVCVCLWACLLYCALASCGAVYFDHPPLPAMGSAAGRIFLAPAYYNQLAVFASPLNAFFTTLYILDVKCMQVKGMQLTTYVSTQLNSDLLKLAARKLNIHITICNITDTVKYM